MLRASFANSGRMRGAGQFLGWAGLIVLLANLCPCGYADVIVNRVDPRELQFK